MKQLAIIVFIVSILSSCGPKCLHGEVEDKKFIPAHTSTYVTYTKIGNISVPHYHTMHIPDEWRVKVRKFDNKKIKIKRVSHSVFNSVNIGSEVKWGECDAESY